MIYGCFLEKSEDEIFLQACFGIETPYYNSFYTTDESNIEEVKKKLKEKFYKKHEMEAFTKEEFDGKNVKATLEKICKNAKSISEAECTFEYISGVVNGIELEEIEEKEYNYGSGSTPTEWYCISYDSDEEETIVYVPSKEYFKSKESWKDFVNKMTGEDALGYTRKLKERPSECKKIDYNGDDYDGGRILNKELNPTEIFVFDKDVLKKISYGSSRDRVKSQTKVVVCSNTSKKSKKKSSSSSSSSSSDSSGSTSSSISSSSTSSSGSGSSGSTSSSISSSSTSSSISISSSSSSTSSSGSGIIISGEEEEKKKTEAKNEREEEGEPVDGQIPEAKVIVYPTAKDQTRSILEKSKKKSISSSSSSSISYGDIYSDKGIRNSSEDDDNEGAAVKPESEEKPAVEPEGDQSISRSSEKGGIISSISSSSISSEKEEAKKKAEEEKKEKDNERKRKDCQGTEKKENKLSTECIKQIMDKMIKVIDDIDQRSKWGENFLEIVFKLISAEAKEYKRKMTEIKNKFNSDSQLISYFSDKENINIKSLQKIVEEKLKIDKSSKYGRTAYGIVLIATALAYYDYCLLKDSNIEIALDIITNDLLRTIKNLDRTGLRNTTIAKKPCLNKLEEMLNKIQTESKKISDEIKTKLKEMSEQSETTSEE